jgi:hypothetical protein
MKTEIKANDLRVGNLFTPIRGNFISNKMFDKKTPEVATMTAQGIVDFESGFIEIEPLELTEELLLKCGFEKTSILGSYLKNTPNTAKGYGIIIHSQQPYSDKHFTDVIEIYQIDGSGLVVQNGLKYIHQLQNLYYALTNEELTINF